MTDQSLATAIPLSLALTKHQARKSPIGKAKKRSSSRSWGWPGTWWSHTPCPPLDTVDTDGSQTALDVDRRQHDSHGSVNSVNSGNGKSRLAATTWSGGGQAALMGIEAENQLVPRPR